MIYIVIPFWKRLFVIGVCKVVIWVGSITIYKFILSTSMIHPEDMLQLAYKCEVKRFPEHVALVFDKDQYPDFLQHYSFFLKLMNYSMVDPEFHKNLQSLTLAQELK